MYTHDAKYMADIGTHLHVLESRCRYPRPSVTVDAAIVAVPERKGGEAQLLLIQRKNPPCKGMWALPGGFVDEGESLDMAAARELQEETSVDIKDLPLFQVGPRPAQPL